MEKVIIGLRNAIGDSDTMIRENAIRAIRHMVVNGDAVLKLRQQVKRYCFIQNGHFGTLVYSTVYYTEYGER